MRARPKRPGSVITAAGVPSGRASAQVTTPPTFLATHFSEPLVETIHGVPRLLSEPAAVEVAREPDAAVPELLLHVDGRHTVLEQQPRERMPQTVRREVRRLVRRPELYGPMLRAAREEA